MDRGQSLEKRVVAGIKGAKKMTLTQLVEAMEEAGTVDLRATEVLPYALRLIGTPKDAKTAAAVKTLRAWVAAGGHRRDVNDDKAYDHSDAVAIMDAWWPKWIEAQFGPALGKTLAPKVIGFLGLGDMPNLHQGSAFDDGIGDRPRRTSARRSASRSAPGRASTAATASAPHAARRSRSR